MYETLLNRMNQRYEALAGVVPDIETDVGIRLRVLAGELESLYQQIEATIKQIFPQSSSGDALAYHGALRGLPHKAGTKATGMLVFSRQSPAQNNIIVPAGTIAATNTVPQLYAKTTAQGVLALGATSVTVSAQAEEGGASGNVQAGGVSVLVSALSGISKVDNPSPFTCGENPETEDEYRRRVLLAYQNPSNGTNLGYYQNLALAVAGVKAVSVLSCPRGRNTVDVIFTPTLPERKQEVQTALENLLIPQREISVDLEVHAAIPKVVPLALSLAPQEEYSFATVKESCQNTIADFFATLPIGKALRLTHLGKALLETEGVENYRFAASPNEVVPLPSQIITLGTLTISDWGS